MFGGHPGRFDQMPEFFDAVQLRAVGWQEVAGDLSPPQDFEVGLNGPRGMKAGVVENDRQRFTDLLAPLGPHQAG